MELEWSAAHHFMLRRNTMHQKVSMVLAGQFYFCVDMTMVCPQAAWANVGTYILHTHSHTHTQRSFGHCTAVTGAGPAPTEHHPSSPQALTHTSGTQHIQPTGHFRAGCGRRGRCSPVWSSPLPVFVHIEKQLWGVNRWGGAGIQKQLFVLGEVLGWVLLG